MRVSVRYFISPDVDLEAFWPDNEDNFSFLLQALVGPAGGEGEESVQFLVCTPQAIQEKVTQERGILFGRSLVIVSSPNISSILDAIRSRIESIEAASWKEVGVHLARLGIYEFEDFI